MRILFTSTPGVGHLLPILPVAVAARDAGHDVVVGCGASVAGVVARAGLAQRLVGPATLHEFRDRIPGFAAAAGPERGALMFREAFATLIARQMADEVLALAADWRPDVLVHEDLEMGGWIAAERLGVPHVTIQATAWRPALRASINSRLDAIRVRLDLPSDPDLAARDGALWFTTRPPALRDPAAPLPPDLRELRPEPDDRLGDAGPPLPAWLAADPGRPRVAVTLGTVNADRIDLFHGIIDGLAGLDVEIAIGLGADPASLGTVPANVHVERYLPMTELLPRSTIVVHHAGSGTTLAALAAGRPSILVPIAADQYSNAAACVAAGAGLILDATALDAVAVRSATRALLDEARYSDQARTVAAEIAAMPGPAAAVDEIARIV